MKPVNDHLRVMDEEVHAFKIKMTIRDLKTNNVKDYLTVFKRPRPSPSFSIRKFGRAIVYSLYQLMWYDDASGLLVRLNLLLGDE